jgi:hypothetical protein
MTLVSYKGKNYPLASADLALTRVTYEMTGYCPGCGETRAREGKRAEIRSDLAGAIAMVAFTEKSVSCDQKPRSSFTRMTWILPAWREKRVIRN